MAGYIGKETQEAASSANGKRLTADKGTQVSKGDLPPAPKTDREKMPPPPIPQGRPREPDTTRPPSTATASTSFDMSPRGLITPTASLSNNSASPARQAQVGSSVQQLVQQGFANETPEQWYNRLKAELAGVEAWRPGHPTGGFAGPGDVFAGLDFLLDQAPSSGCAYGCGKPGGEHAVDCPGLMAGRY